MLSGALSSLILNVAKLIDFACGCDTLQDDFAWLWKIVLESIANTCKVMQSHAKSCKVMQSHAKSCKVMQSHAKSTLHRTIYTSFVLGRRGKTNLRRFIKQITANSAGVKNYVSTGSYVGAYALNPPCGGFTTDILMANICSLELWVV